MCSSIFSCANRFFDVLGRESSRGSYGPEPSTSPYRESMMESRVFRQEMPPYRPPEVQLSHSYKSQGEKYGSLVESGNRYHRDREREMQHHRERVNSLDKTNPPAFYSSCVHTKNVNKQDNTGSIGRRHHGCSASLSEANVRDMYGAMLSERNDPAKSLGRAAGVHSNSSKQRGGLEAVERERERDRDREKEYRRNTACNNSLDCKRDNLLASFATFLQHVCVRACVLQYIVNLYFARCTTAIGSQLQFRTTAKTTTEDAAAVTSAATAAAS